MLPPQQLDGTYLCFSSHSAHAQMPCHHLPVSSILDFQFSQGCWCIAQGRRAWHSGSWDAWVSWPKGVMGLCRGQEGTQKGS